MVRGLRLRPICLVLIAALAGGCVRGVADYQLYVQAFNAQYEQGDAILNVVAQAERKVVKRNLPTRNFNPDTAAYYVDAVDPPLTGAVRASLRSLKSYNEALGGLANGEAAAALANRMSTLATNLVGAAAATQIALAGAPAVPGVNAFVARTASALDLTAPIVKQVVTFAARESFRQQLIAHYPAMKDLLVTLRGGTPVMFAIIRRSRVTPGSLDNATGIADAAALEKERQLLASWVVLLDKTLIAMEAAVVAAMSDTSLDDLSYLSEASLELKMLAEQVKKLRNTAL